MNTTFPAEASTSTTEYKLMPEGLIATEAHNKLFDLKQLFAEGRRLPCLERERGVCTIHGDNYCTVDYDPAYNLSTHQGRELWKKEKDAGERYIPEDGAAYIWHLYNFVVEPTCKELMADLMPQKLQYTLHEAGAAKRIHEQYLKEYEDRMGMPQLPRLRDMDKRKHKSEKLWSERNKAIGEVFKSHPEGMPCHELYQALACGIAKNISYGTFRSWMYDNRCAFKLAPKGNSGFYQVTQK